MTLPPSSETARPAGARRVAVFGFDASESSQIRRIRGLIGAGFDVVGYTMRRDNMASDAPPEWRNIHLGTVENERIGRRLLVLARALLVIARNGGPLRRADVAMARNFDMALLAVIGRVLVGRPRLPVIYECLDIHGSFTAPGRKGRMFRAIERWLLRRTALLVVSSPGFVREYFQPVQHWHGPTALLENKIWFGAERPARPVASREHRREGPIVVGWVGSLRCDPSLRILLDAARLRPDTLRIEMHGNVHRHVVPDFEARIAALPNVSYHGPYRYPDGLGEVYSRCDLVWSQDLWQSGANSDWLLPNRVYEASYFGCLSIAVAGTQTARKVEDDGLGYVVPVADAPALVALIDGLDPAETEARRAALLAQAPERFVSTPADLREVVARALDETHLSQDRDRSRP